MNTVYLASFLEVIQSKSIAEAARRLDITPGAISARIRTLEVELGAVLIQRSGQAVKPTEAGMRIYDRARALVQDSRDLRAIASKGNVAGELKLGVFLSALSTHLPVLLEQFCGNYPELSIYISHGPSVELCRKVHSGLLDAAFVIELQFAIPKTCEWRALQEEPLILIAPTALGGGKAHQLLTSKPFIRYDRSVYSGQLVDRYLKDNNIVPNQRLEVDSLAAIVALVERGVGIALVPDSFSINYQTGALVKIPLPARTPIRRVGIIWATQGPRTALAEALVKHARETFP